MNAPRTFEFDDHQYVYLDTAQQADAWVSDDDIASCLEGWFGDRRTVPAEEFIDRIVKDYGTLFIGETGFDIDDYDNEASRQLLRRARRIKRELEG